MVIRKAGIADIDKIVKNRMEFLSTENNGILSDDFIDAMRSFLIRHIEEESIIIWIADRYNEIISIAIICCFEMLPSADNLFGKVGYIENVNTHPDYQRQGLATNVLTKALEEAKKKGIKYIQLEASNQGISLFKKLGFRIMETDMKMEL